MLISAANRRLPRVTPLITGEVSEGRLEGEGGTKTHEKRGGTDTCKMKMYRKHALWLMPPEGGAEILTYACNHVTRCKDPHTHATESNVSRAIIG